MKYKSYARMFEIHVFIVVFGLPSCILFFVEQLGYAWIVCMLLAQVAVILLFLLRKGWMAFLRSKFPNLSLYAIRTALGGLLLLSAGTIIWVSVNDRDDTLMTLGGLVMLLGALLASIAFLGTLAQAFSNSVQSLIELLKGK